MIWGVWGENPPIIRGQRSYKLFDEVDRTGVLERSNNNKVLFKKTYKAFFCLVFVSVICMSNDEARVSRRFIAKIHSNRKISLPIEFFKVKYLQTGNFVEIEIIRVFSEDDIVTEVD